MDPDADVARLRGAVDEIRAIINYTILVVDVVRAELLGPLRDAVKACDHALGTDRSEAARAALLREALATLDGTTDADLRERIRVCLGLPESSDEE